MSQVYYCDACKPSGIAAAEAVKDMIGNHAINSVLDLLPQVLSGHQIQYNNSEDWNCTCGDGRDYLDPGWGDWPITHILDVVNRELRIS